MALKTANQIIERIKAQPAGALTYDQAELNGDPQDIQTEILAAFTDGSRLFTSRATESHLVVTWTSE